MTSSSPVSINLSSTDENDTHDYFLSINKSYIDLTLKANGKADLYFHAYVWYVLIQTLFYKSNPKASD